MHIVSHIGCETDRTAANRSRVICLAHRSRRSLSSPIWSDRAAPAEPRHDRLALCKRRCDRRLRWLARTRSRDVSAGSSLEISARGSRVASGRARAEPGAGHGDGRSNRACSAATGRSAHRQQRVRTGDATPRARWVAGNLATWQLGIGFEGDSATDQAAGQSGGSDAKSRGRGDLAVRLSRCSSAEG